MSESDSTSRRRPPTIDLTATEVGGEKQGAAKDAGPAKPSGPGLLGRLRHHAKGAIAGAFIVAAIVAGLWIAGYGPSRETAPAGAPAARPSLVDDIAARLDKIQAALPGQQPDAALATRIAAVEAATKSLSDSLAALSARVDQVAAAAQSAQAQAKSAADVAAAAQAGAKSAGDAAGAAQAAAEAGVAKTDLDALSARVAALESAVKSVSDNAGQAPSADDRTARLIVATEALRDAAERGTPYQAELAAVQSLGADAGATAPLKPFAATGIPSAAALAQELAALAPALLQASEPASSDSSLLGRLKINAQKLVRVTPVDAPAGDDPVSVVTRIEVDAAHADIAAALADIAKLPEPAKSLAAAWVQKAQARNAAIAASRSLAENALAALGKTQ